MTTQTHVQGEAHGKNKQKVQLKLLAKGRAQQLTGLDRTSKITPNPHIYVIPVQRQRATLRYLHLGFPTGGLVILLRTRVAPSNRSA